MPMPVVASNSTADWITLNPTWFQWTTTNTITTAITTQVWQNWNVPYTATTSPWLTADEVALGAAHRAAEALARVRDEPGPLDPRYDWRAEEQEINDARREREEQTAAARAEGGRLLTMVLNPVQRAELARHRWFEVLGRSGQLWRVHHGVSGNVRAIGPDGSEIMAICAHPAMWDNEHRSYLPTEDVMAAQALALMHDDRDFLAKANVHRGSRFSPDLAPTLRLASRLPVPAEWAA